MALTANLLNLLDRAPGRAGKFALVIIVPLVLWGSPPWVVASAGTIAALLVCLPADLGARAMLGDAGANPLGGVVGLGLALSLNETWRLVAIGVLVLLNLASERWSFSELIERVRSAAGVRHVGTDLQGRSSGENERDKADTNGAVLT